MMKKLLIPLILGCILALIILALPGKEDVFPLTADDVLEELGKIDRIIKPGQLKSFQGGDSCIVVDLNPREQFSESHLPLAVNFPSAEMDVRSIHEFFDEPVSYLLYADETSTACKNMILFTQMGIKNVWVLDTVLQASQKIIPDSLNY